MILLAPILLELRDLFRYSGIQLPFGLHNILDKISFGILYLKNGCKLLHTIIYVYAFHLTFYFSKCFMSNALHGAYLHQLARRAIDWLPRLTPVINNVG